MEPAFSGAYFLLLLSDFSHLERWLTSFTLVRCEEDRVEKLHFFFFFSNREETKRKREERRKRVDDDYDDDDKDNDDENVI